MFCTTCASPNSLMASTCSACGASLSHVERRAGFGAARHASASHRRLARIAVALLPLVVLVTGVAVAVANDRAAVSDRAAAYERGIAALSAGDYAAAMAGFDAAADYRDAPAQYAAAREALLPYQIAYDDGVAALGGGRYREAIDQLLPVARDVPGYEDAASLLEQARDGLTAELTQAATAAETRRDWIAAEAALVELAALDPTDAAVITRLTELRQTHAPIVFARGNELYVAAPDGSEATVVSAEVPVTLPIWSPNRKQIAFLSRTPGDGPTSGTLYVVDRDGRNLKALATRVLARRSWPAWSPDGTRIAFTSFADYNDALDEGKVAVHVVDVATGVETDLTGDRKQHAGAVTWSPDSTRIAFVSYAVYHLPTGGQEYGDGDVFVLDLETNELTNVTRARVRDDYRVAWSPVDDRLLIFTMEGDWSDPDPSEIFILDLMSDHLTQIDADAWQIGFPVWSPDGSRIAFVEGENILRIVSGHGDTRIPLRSGISPYPSWSADGALLFLPSEDGRGPSYVVPVDAWAGQVQTIDLVYDASRDQSGPPVWTPRTTPAMPLLPTDHGTALDPGPEPARAILADS